MFLKCMKLFAFLSCLMCISFVESGCGECVFEEPVKGVVLDQNGKKVSGLTLTACKGCDKNNISKQDCISAKTDKGGRFSMMVPHCRPAGFQCSTWPITLTHDKCTNTIIQPEVPTDRVNGATYKVTCK